MIFSELSVKQLMLKDFRNILGYYLNSPAKAFLGATMLSFHIPSAMLVMLHELDGPFSLPRLSVFQDGLEGGRVGRRRRRGGGMGVWLPANRRQLRSSENSKRWGAAPVHWTGGGRIKSPREKKTRWIYSSAMKWMCQASSWSLTASTAR